MKKLLKSKKGFTLMESIVAIGICAIIMASAALVLPNVLRVYDRANIMAERNTLLNNVANIIIADLTDLAEPLSDESLNNENNLALFTGVDHVVYTIDNGILNRSVDKGEATPVLPPRYYGRSQVSFVCNEVTTTQGGEEVLAYQLTITVNSIRDSGAISRSYMVKPLVLNQFTEGT
jgi:prepilin-type N-terminal cleavage/methylation domain-containing protein